MLSLAALSDGGEFHDRPRLSPSVKVIDMAAWAGDGTSAHSWLEVYLCDWFPSFPERLVGGLLNFLGGWGERSWSRCVTKPLVPMGLLGDHVCSPPISSSSICIWSASYSTVLLICTLRNKLYVSFLAGYSVGCTASTNRSKETCHHNGAPLSSRSNRRPVIAMGAPRGGRRGTLPRWEGFDNRPTSLGRCRKSPKKKLLSISRTMPTIASAFCLPSSAPRATSTRSSFVHCSTTLTTRVRSYSN